jgi:HD-like signal output (HDOD) protein
MNNLDVSAINDLVMHFAIPCQPLIVDRILLELDKENPSIDDVCMMINSDVSLAASVMKIANNPAFFNKEGRSEPFNSLDDAAFCLGIDRLRKLVQTLVYRDKLQEESQGLEQLTRFWDSSSDVAVAAAHLAQRLFCCSPDDSYMFGLFRDCGIPAMMHGVPGYREFMNDITQSGSYTFISELEDKLFGINHQVVGYCVANEWNLPEHIARSILTHEVIDPPDNDKTTINAQKNVMNSLVYVSEVISDKFRQSSDPLSTNWRPIPENVYLNLEISEEDLFDLMEDTLEKLEGIIAGYHCF